MGLYMYFFFEIVISTASPSNIANRLKQAYNSHYI